MKYQVGDRVITATSAADLVKKMHASEPFLQASSDAKFMQETAHLTRMTNGQVIQVDTPENFVAGLIAVGFIKSIGE